MLALRGPSYLSRLWCCVEIYCFYEMTQGTDAKSRIEILDFPSAPPYTPEGVFLGVPHEATAHDGSFVTRSRTLPPLYQRFDVQQTRCAFPLDHERMLNVIEGCGAGFDAFNTFMHAMLLSSGHSSPARRARLGHGFWRSKEVHPE